VNSLNDTAKLYQLFGGQPSDYQELRRSEQAKTAKQRWPLLAWLDLSALHVSEAPKVQVGEHASPKQAQPTPPTPAAWSAPAAAPQRPVAQATGALAQQVQAPAKLQLKPMPLPQATPTPVSTPAVSQAPTQQGTAPQVPTASPAQTASAPYLQQLMGAPARLQALGAAQTVATVATVPSVPSVADVKVGVHTTPAVASTPAVSASSSQGLQEIFSRIAQPAASTSAPATPIGSLWSNLTSKP